MSLRAAGMLGAMRLEEAAVVSAWGLPPTAAAPAAAAAAAAAAAVPWPRRRRRRYSRPKTGRGPDWTLGFFCAEAFPRGGGES
eukprot:SAG22_NODE_1867_length_3405_cov_56.547792_1_plen_82_part_10